ncbi:MAG: hypothetical protein ACRC7W_01675 [Fusobacteriaceae bacterium]
MGRNTKNKLERTKNYNSFNKNKIKYTQLKPVTFDEIYKKSIKIIETVVVSIVVLLVIFNFIK